MNVLETSVVVERLDRKGLCRSSWDVGVFARNFWYEKDNVESGDTSPPLLVMLVIADPGRHVSL